MRIWTSLVTLVVVALLTVGSPAGSQSQGLTPLRVAIALPVSVFYPVYIADQLGFFKDEGLDVTLVTFRGGPELLSVMLTGEVDVGTTAITEALTAAEAGTPIKMFWPVCNSAGIVLMSKPEYKTAADLKGKRFAVSTYGGLYHMTIELFAARQGLDSKRDLRYVQVGPQVMEALETGSVDVAPMGEVPGMLLARKGFVKQAALSDYLPQFPCEAYMAPAKRIAEKEDAFRRLTRATQRGAVWFRDPANKERAIQVLVDVLKMKPAVARAAYESDYGATERFPTKGVWPVEGIQASIDFVRAQGRLTKPVTVDDLVDYRFTGK